VNEATSRAIDEQIRREKAAAWEAGFYAGQQFGQAWEKHDPQWDMDDYPSKPSNPYDPLKGNQR
jgi:hypothetical protein